jgi:tetratricopeptide (TPR) repeat protein
VHDEVIALSKKAIEINPNSADAYGNLAAAYGFKSDYLKVINYAEKAIDLNPGFSPAYNNLAVAYFYLGQYDLASNYAIKAIDYGFNPDRKFLSMLKTKLKNR